MFSDPIIMVAHNNKYVVKPPTWAVIELDVTPTSRKFYIKSLTICEREAIASVAESLTLFSNKSGAWWRTIAAKVITSPMCYVEVPEYKDNAPAWGLSQIPFRVTTGLAMRGLLAGCRVRIIPRASEVPNVVRSLYSTGGENGCTAGS